MDLNLNFGQPFVNELGENLACYERTEKFAFMCPYTENEDGSITLKISKTYVYSLIIEENGDNLAEAIDTIVVEEE